MLRKLLAVSGALLVVAVGVAAYNVVFHYVHWTPTEDIRIDSNGATLAGTLVLPSGDGPFPAVLLLHGSGPEKRGDPANNILINALAREGIASLTYDKRGAGESSGDFESAKYSDFIADALAALSYLEARPEIDGQRIGLYAISESGWFGPEIASRNGNVAFLATKVGCPLSWHDTVAWEVRNDLIAEGFPVEAAERMASLARKRWAYYADAARDASLAAGARRDAINAEIAELRASIPGADEALAPELMAYDADDYADFAADSSYDPQPWIAELDIPMFFAYGGRDINVPTSECAAWLDGFRDRTGRDVRVEIYAEAGHSLAHWSGLTTMGFVPRFVSSLTEWIVRHAHASVESGN